MRTEFEEERFRFAMSERGNGSETGVLDLAVVGGGSASTALLSVASGTGDDSTDGCVFSISPLEEAPSPVIKSYSSSPQPRSALSFIL